MRHVHKRHESAELTASAQSARRDTSDAPHPSAVHRRTSYNPNTRKALTAAANGSSLATVRAASHGRAPSPPTPAPPGHPSAARGKAGRVTRALVTHVTSPKGCGVIYTKGLPPAVWRSSKIDGPGGCILQSRVSARNSLIIWEGELVAGPY